MTFMFLALAQLTNKAFTDAGKGRIRQSLTALVKYRDNGMLFDHIFYSAGDQWNI